MSATNTLASDMLAKHDLTLAQWIVLGALWRKDGLTVGEVAKYYRVNNPAASRILDRMTEAGLVSRQPDPESRRTTRVYLTKKARDMSHLLGFYGQVNEKLLAGFTDREAAQLSDMLERLAKNANEANKT